MITKKCVFDIEGKVWSEEYLTEKYSSCTEAMKHIHDNDTSGEIRSENDGARPMWAEN